MKIFTKKSLLVLTQMSAFLLTSCGGKSVLKSYSKKLGVDLDKGEIIHYEDNHGGFLGDGFMLCISKYGNDDIENQISESDKFHKYPLSENLHTFIYDPFDSNLEIPEFENGYYYFKNRHSNATDVLTDSELFGTVSFNFSFVLYDCNADLAYICDYDT